MRSLLLMSLCSMSLHAGLPWSPNLAYAGVTKAQYMTRVSSLFTHGQSARQVSKKPVQSQQKNK